MVLNLLKFMKVYRFHNSSHTQIDEFFRYQWRWEHQHNASSIISEIIISTIIIGNDVNSYRLPYSVLGFKCH